MEGEVDSLCLQMNAKVFYILIVSLWVCVASHAQSTQKMYLKKELGDQLDFLHSDKHENLLQIDSMTLMIV